MAESEQLAVHATLADSTCSESAIGTLALPMELAAGGEEVLMHNQIGKYPAFYVFLLHCALCIGHAGTRNTAHFCSSYMRALPLGIAAKVTQPELD